MEYRDMNTPLLAYELVMAVNDNNNQQKINDIAYELTCRFYKPYSDSTFEQTLEKFGYKQIAPKESKAKSIHIGR